MENSLINETSPYLLQHAHNPVNWYAWNQESLDKAKQEDKPIIVSIGYSTCHWCHVMERESFEKEDIAKVMNEHFVCIKVDREERPDVDQVYMEALHSMGLQGGWPLNVFLTPEQKPFYGGTYFPAQGWKDLLLNVAEVFGSKREQLEESALKFVEAIKGNKLPGGEVGSSAVSADSLDAINSNLIKGFDTVKGGTGSAPKFPMPVIWNYIIQYLSNEDHKELSDQLHLTLEKIALGGIYDQIGGGFARYSTDADWFAPHFEKMLYDNGQLLSLYAQAYKLKPDSLYKDAVYQTVEWLKREMRASNGAFYSALDADSEGIEGKFYVWTESELKDCLKEQFDLAKSYYNTTPSGNWENGWNILHRNTDDMQFGKENSLEISELKRNIRFINEKLLNYRAPRIRPGLDDKILIGWNALMSKGLLDAFSAFEDEEFLELAVKNIDYILSDLVDGVIVYHSAGKKINGFLDDYALLIELLIEAYQVTFDEQYLIKAKSLTDQCIEDFFDKEDQFFFYTSRGSERLIADKKELYDNVIPASNSIMSSNLYKLGILFEEPQYAKKSKMMLHKLLALTEREPRYMTNWAVTVAQMVNPPFEIVIIGEKAKEYRSELAKHKLPGHLYLGSTNRSGSALSMLENRDAIDGQTTIYVCKNKTCQLPVQSVEEALGQMI